VEFALRTAVLQAGAKALENLVSGLGRGRRGEALICCGHRMESDGVEEKTLLTILGEVRFARSRYVCPVCAKARFPGDEELDVVGTTRSPGVRRLTARMGSRETFKEGAEDLRILAGISVSAKDVERTSEKMGREMEAWAAEERKVILAREPPLLPVKTIPVLYVMYDGTGVPMVPREVEGRRGKQEDGTSKTREAKLGCVFTQTTTDDDGFPVRDEDSTSYVGAIEAADVFADRIEAEAIRRGLWNALLTVVLGDGAKWIWALAGERFPGALQIVDKYHAREHVADLARLSAGGDEKAFIRLRTRWWMRLDSGEVEKIAREARTLTPKEPAARKKAATEVGYLETNKERMRYNKFRERGLFVGSGVIEAGCRHVIGLRLKQSGMEWSVEGANAIISLRCVTLSGRLEDYWEDRSAAKPGN